MRFSWNKIKRQPFISVKIIMNRREKFFLIYIKECHPLLTAIHLTMLLHIYKYRVVTNWECYRNSLLRNNQENLPKGHYCHFFFWFYISLKIDCVEEKVKQIFLPLWRVVYESRKGAFWFFVSHSFASFFVRESSSCCKFILESQHVSLLLVIFTSRNCFEPFFI